MNIEKEIDKIIESKVDMKYEGKDISLTREQFLSFGIYFDKFENPKNK